MTASDRPTLRVVSGSPTPDELAVLTAIVTAASGGAAPVRPEPHRGGWSDPVRRFRPPLLPGPNAWRSAYLPS